MRLFTHKLSQLNTSDLPRRPDRQVVPFEAISFSCFGKVSAMPCALHRLTLLGPLEELRVLHLKHIHLDTNVNICFIHV